MAEPFMFSLIYRLGLLVKKSSGLHTVDLFGFPFWFLFVQKSFSSPVSGNNFFGFFPISCLNGFHELNVVSKRNLKKGGIIDHGEYLIAVEGEFFSQIDQRLIEKIIPAFLPDSKMNF